MKIYVHYKIHIKIIKYVILKAMQIIVYLKWA